MYRHCEPTGRANARTPLARRPGQAKREPGSIRRALSFWARRRRPSVPTNAGGYGSLLSQGRRKRIRSSNSKHAFALAARCARVVDESLAQEDRGRGECRVPAAPAASCALVESTRVFTTGPPGSPGIPARNGFNGFLRALPGDRACLPPSLADYGFVRPGRADKTSANLTPASGRQDHTTSPSAAPVCAKGFAGLKCQSAEALAKAEASLVRVPLIAHRPKPALQPRCAQNAAASTASRPASVTIAIRPSVGRDARTPRDVSTKLGSEIFFESGLDSQIARQPVGQISRPVRMALRA